LLCVPWWQKFFWGQSDKKRGLACARPRRQFVSQRELVSLMLFFMVA
jgi:hypothetical protein